MWISAPMPVITRIITLDSGSSRSVNGASNSPDEIQLNTRCTISRDCGSRPTSDTTAARATANDATIAPTATADDARLARRRPKLALTRKPRNGRSAISSSMRGPPLPLERPEHLGVERFVMPEQRDHDRQANGRLSGGDSHYEEHDDLPVGGAEPAAEGDERQVHRVQHDLDRQQDRDHVAAQEHAGGADREQDRGEHEVVVEGRHGGSSVPTLLRGAPARQRRPSPPESAPRSPRRGTRSR